MLMPKINQNFYCPLYSRSACLALYIAKSAAPLIDWVLQKRYFDNNLGELRCRKC